MDSFSLVLFCVSSLCGLLMDEEKEMFPSNCGISFNPLECGLEGDSTKTELLTDTHLVIDISPRI